MNINTKKYWNEFFSKDRFQKRHCWRTGPYKLIAKHFDFTKVNNKSIIDIGCAFGDGLDYIKKINKNNIYIGLDFSNKCIEEAKNKYKEIEFHAEDINKFNAECDIIIVAETLEHLDNDKQIIKELRELCNTLIITVPNNEIGRFGKLIDEHVNSYTAKDFKGAKVYEEENYLVVIYN